MPQPDGPFGRDKIIAFPGAAAGVTAAPRPRDPRIDFFRGLALVMILINHIPGNPYEILTTRTFGFSDAAEAFFVMSGIAAGIAYSGPMARWCRGEATLWSAVSPLWARSWTLYLVQLALTVAALALYAWAADIFLWSEFRLQHNLGPIYAETGAALAGLATLGYQIGYVNILPAYIVLLLVAPLAIWGGLRAPRATIAVAALIWLGAGWQQWNIPSSPGGGGWFFSPFAWQVIFTLGLVIGVLHRQDRRLVPVSRPLFWTAAGFLLLVLAWRHVPVLGAWLNHKMYLLGTLGAPSNVVSHNKAYLALPRLLHILALVYVISCLPRIREATAHRLAAPLRLLGRQGLLVFAAGTVLALASQILMDVEPDAAWIGWALPPVCLAILFGLAAMKEGSLRSVRRVRQEEPQPRPGGIAASR